MLGVPIRFEVRVDLAVNQENTGRSLIHPGTHWAEIANRPYRRRPCAIAACNGSEIRFRKLHEIDRIALAPEVVDFGRI